MGLCLLSPAPKSVTKSLKECVDFVYTDTVHGVLVDVTRYKYMHKSNNSVTYNLDAEGNPKRHWQIDDEYLTKEVN